MTLEPITTDDGSPTRVAFVTNRVFVTSKTRFSLFDPARVSPAAQARNPSIHLI